MTTLRGTDGVVVDVEPYGPDQAAVQQAKRALERGALAELLDGAKHRWLAFRFDEGAAVPTHGGGHDPDIPDDAQRFRATVYDYTNLRVLDIGGELGALADVEVTVSARDTVPTPEEFRDAVAHLSARGQFAVALRSGELRPYRPMPPFVRLAMPDGRARRLVTVGLYANNPGSPGYALLRGRLHQIVAVDLENGEVFAGGSVGLHTPDEDRDCGVDWDDECDEAGDTGQAVVRVHQGGTELWRLRVVRPAASSGRNGSGAELRNVSYRNRSVLRRAHVPILNVRYEDLLPACGPSFRDWLDEEACYVAHGEDVAPGVRVCEEPPLTMLESGFAGGNFRGVALHMDGPDLLITSELQAGWYRYITEWRLRPDGSIRPRMGFAAVKNFCTCEHHIHHAYWRFHWAIGKQGHHTVAEFNDPPEPLADDNWVTFQVEQMRLRDEQRRRHWRISHRQTDLGYLLVPGAGDGETDLYGAGDAWFLRFHENEIDDGQGFTSNPALSRPRIDLFVDGEWLDGEDVVTWYAAHWDHAPNRSGAYLGPELIPDPPNPPGGPARNRLSAEEG